VLLSGKISSSIQIRNYSCKSTCYLYRILVTNIYHSVSALLVSMIINGISPNICQAGSKLLGVWYDHKMYFTQYMLFFFNFERCLILSHGISPNNYHSVSTLLGIWYDHKRYLTQYLPFLVQRY
jgi:hypothetical protein